MNHHKVQSIPAAAPCRAGDIISLDRTGYGVTSGAHWEFYSDMELSNDLYLLPQDQRTIDNFEGSGGSAGQFYIPWNMPNGIAIGDVSGTGRIWYLSRKDKDFWYTIHSSYDNALAWVAGATYAGRGAGINLNNNTALAFVAPNQIGVALHDVWPHETGQPFAISVFRGVVRTRIRQAANVAIDIGTSISLPPFQPYAGRTNLTDPASVAQQIGFTLTGSPAATFVQYPMLEVIMRR